MFQIEQKLCKRTKNVVLNCRDCLVWPYVALHGLMWPRMALMLLFTAMTMCGLIRISKALCVLVWSCMALYGLVWPFYGYFMTLNGRI